MVRQNLCSTVLLNDSHLALQNLVRDFAQKEVAPKAAEIDENHRYPSELISQMASMGLMGLMVAPEWGGSGLDAMSYVTALEEISVACASTSVVMSVNNSLVCHPIEAFGTLEQKTQWLTDLAQGRKLGCYCLSEPGSGSDAAAMKTRAVEKDGGWVLNGVKNFITNGREADLAVVYAIVDPSRAHQGIGCFLVDLKAKGVSIGKLERKLGIRGSSTAQIIMENVWVPSSALVGEPFQGFKIAMNTLDGGRIGIAAQAVGIARAVCEEAITYTGDRQAFGKPIAHLGAIQIHLADMATETEASRLLMRAAAFKKDQGLNFSREAAQAKLFASETCMSVATRGIQVLGGYGYTQDYAMERHFRDAKITEIYEGTSEIQRIVIARSLAREFGIS